MTIKKIKLSDIAKDLNVPAKEVAEMLAKHFGTEQKKPAQTLSRKSMLFLNITPIPTRSRILTSILPARTRLRRSLKSPQRLPQKQRQP